MDNKKAIEQLKAARDTLQAYKEKRLGASTTSAQEAPNSKAMELRACAKFGVKSLNELITINTADRKYKALSHEDRQAVKNLKEAVDVAVMCSTVFKKPIKSTVAYEQEIQPALKAFGIASGEQGYDWIPTAISESYVEEYNLDRKVAALFTEIKMPTNPYKYPVMSNGFIGRKLGENAQLGSKDQFTTTSITFNAVKISNQAELPEELNEDSAVDVMKAIRAQLMEGQEKAMEIAILEGDTATTHQHTNTQIPGASGAPAADSAERLFDGLRKRCLANAATKVDCGAVPVDESKLSSLRQALKKFGVNSSELALIVGVKGHNELMQLDDVRTLEQYGPQAPVLSGELAKYEGIPVIVSEWLREDTSASGVNGASGNTKASMILVNRKRFFTGLRRATQVKVESNRTAFDCWDMVSFKRAAFEGVLKADGSNAASEPSAAILYNIA